MSSSSSTERRTVEPLPASAWAPRLDLTPAGLSAFDPARVEQAVDEGYEAGFAAGRAEAMARGDEHVQAELARFRDQARILFERLATAAEKVEAAEARNAEMFARTVAETATGLAEAIVARELSDETSAVVATLDRVLGAVDRNDQVWVQVHPDDAELLASVEVPDRVHVEANPGLRRGDAVARTDDRTIDARIAAALDRARSALEVTP